MWPELWESRGQISIKPVNITGLELDFPERTLLSVGKEARHHPGHPTCGNDGEDQRNRLTWFGQGNPYLCRGPRVWGYLNDSELISERLTHGRQVATRHSVANFSVLLRRL